MFILASNSPRRRELLSLIGIDFSVHAPEICEDQRELEKPRDYVLRMSKEKALMVSSYYDNFDFLLGADTIVVIGDEIIGKPIDDEDTVKMIKKLSGKTHRVITAFTIIAGEKTINKSVSTDVTFKELSDDEIIRYVETGEAYDKAGAYAIQGYASYMVKSIKGSYTNVVGLPLTEVYEALEKLGFNF